jgi:hypothetical protein
VHLLFHQFDTTVVMIYHNGPDRLVQTAVVAVVRAACSDSVDDCNLELLGFSFDLQLAPCIRQLCDRLSPYQEQLHIPHLAKTHFIY